jgi:hypothetical protein
MRWINFGSGDKCKYFKDNPKGLVKPLAQPLYSLKISNI